MLSANIGLRSVKNLILFFCFLQINMPTEAPCKAKMSLVFYVKFFCNTFIV